MKKRQAMIGYGTYWLGRRVVRRELTRRIASLAGPAERTPLWRRLPLLGAVAAAIAAGVVVVTRRRG